MRYLLLTAALCALFCTEASAHQRGHYLAYRHYHNAHHQHVAYRRHRDHLPVVARYGGCARAAALGGPCGCVAMGLVGLHDTKFWRAAEWLSFPRANAHVGAAAVWRGGHHVEIVSSLNNDGTVNTRGSVGHSHVRLSLITLVEPK